MTKRLVTIQDLSCIGRCSLAVAMSLVPAMGVETAVLPTAILSTHTAFDSFTFLDFTPEAEKIMAQWQRQGMEFDAVYIGYLGSVQLIDLAKRFLSAFCNSGTAQGVSLTGLKFCLDNATLTSSFPVGVSNEFLGKESSVSSSGK